MNTAEETRDSADAASRGTDPVVIANDDRHIVDANEAACELLGRTRAEILELRIEDIASPDLAPEVERMWAQFLALRRLSGVFAVRTSTGDTRVVNFAALADFPVPGIHLSRLRPTAKDGNGSSSR
jgi:PAS domain S-box-containing protein